MWFVIHNKVCWLWTTLITFPLFFFFFLQSKARHVSSQQKFSPLYVLLSEHFCVFRNVSIAMVHMEATLKGLNKPDLIKLVLQLESEMNFDIKELASEIRDLVPQMKKVEADVVIVKNVNEKLVNQLIETEQQCWANAQYSRRECLEVVRIPTPIHNN